MPLPIMNTSYHFSSSTTTFFSPYQNDQTTPTPPNPTNPVPIHFPSPPPTPVPIRFPDSVLTSAATRIQATYRSHLVLSLIRKIRAVRSEADRMERLIQRQETVDAVRSDEKERVRVNEGLMALLLKLDSVPGYFDPNVRGLRRDLSRRIVGLQEVLDGIVAGRGMDGGYCEGVPGSWEELVEKIWAEEEERRGMEGASSSSCCCEYVSSIII